MLKFHLHAALFAPAVEMVNKTIPSVRSNRCHGYGQNSFKHASLTSVYTLTNKIVLFQLFDVKLCPKNANIFEKI